ncbi:BA75_00210T0 [Komagataella pastoris]|uniref:Probable vacuolar protein sorting-associated protein 16 homolog n=1 Tax=Komagataella pastoris TaxID=4922 RepID=A0A1B2J999_PICPA|nr:BA75_00210T0 [Komagataella pastoris]
MNNPSLGWERLDTVFYRLRECYSPLQWDIELDEQFVAISNSAAAIAVFNSHSSHTSIDIFSGSGVLLNSIPWLLSNGQIVAMSWTDKEELLVVLQNGTIRKFSDLTSEFDEFGLNLPDESIVQEAKFFQDGIVVLTNEKKFIFFSSFSQLPRQFTLNVDSIDCWNVLYSDRVLQLFVSSNKSIHISTLTTETSVKFGQVITGIEFPPNGSFASLLTPDNLIIATSDLENLLSEFSHNFEHVHSMQWCSNDAVVLATSDELQVIGPGDDSISFYYENRPFIRSQNDGLTVLTQSKLEFLSRVANFTEETFRIGSTKASAILLDSIDQLDRHSPKADENLRIVKPNLVEAVDNCIRSASEEFDPQWQKKLLRAASFGKSILDFYSSEEFVEICNNLRVLNAVRQPEVGMFITYAQLLNYGHQGLIESLIRRRLFLLASKICKFLSLFPDNIYYAWAKLKIKNSYNKNDKELSETILDKLAETERVSYTGLSEVAYNEGRVELAHLLLDHEPVLENQVPLLLQMGQDKNALLKSEQSGNVDLICSVLLRLYYKLSLSQFFILLSDSTDISIGIFKDIIGSVKPDLLLEYYYQDDQLIKIAESNLIQDSTYSLDAETKRNRLLELLKAYEGKKFYENDVPIIESHLKLLNYQETLSKKFNHSFDSFSKIETISELARLDDEKLTETQKYAYQFGISSTQLYHSVVKSLAKSHQWDKLYQFAKSKKSPVGYELFFRECYLQNEKRQAGLYIGMCKELTYKARADLYLKIGEYRLAADEASKKKDIDLLQLVKDTAGSTNVGITRLIEDYVTRIG